MDGFWTLERTARLLNRRNGAGKALPALLVFTDPARTPDPEALARRLPEGAALVWRTFGAFDAALGRRLARIAHGRGAALMVGADAGLALAVGADGVHLPERLATHARRIAQARPGWIVTAAAHSQGALVRAQRAGAQAAVLSAAFESRSASAGRPLGPVRMSALAHGAPLPVYGLGGINNKTARRLVDAGLVGLAAVEALSLRT
jgi:thiamine-phosphate pyrophosphorylase